MFNFPSYTKTFYIILCLLCILLIGQNVLLNWIAQNTIIQFEKSHNRIAVSTTKIVSTEINHFIVERQKQVKLFIEDELQLISNLSKDLDDEQLKQKIIKRLKRRIPDLFTVTLADLEGNTLIDDFDGNLGDLCITDMKALIRTKQSPIRIHPNSIAYHFDIMLPWHLDTNAGIFFASFKPTEITHILQFSSPLDHELMLIDASRQNLIELFETGARITVPRDDYRLPKNMINRILARQKVNRTEWTLLDVINQNIFEQYKNSTYVKFILMALGFNILVITLIIIIVIIETLRLRAEELKEEMFSIFSHDLRSPLTAISGSIGLLLNHAQLSKHQQNEILELCDKNTSLLIRIVNDILDIQKLEAHSITYDKSLHDIFSVVKSAVKLNIHYAHTVDVTLALEPYNEKLSVNIDEQRIIQVLTNLITNAVKFTPTQGEVIIFIYKKSNTVEISVKDRGPGISKEFQPHLFKKFSQSSQSNYHGIKSTGLGLAIVKQIIEAHKGRIFYETEINLGTTFTISLPIYQT